MLVVDDIPKAWRRALAAVQVTYPDAMILGGALRDREHGVRVKDLDIFASAKPDDTGPTPIIDRLKRDGWLDPKMNGDESYNGVYGHIAGVIDMNMPGCPPLQLIVTRAARSTWLDELDFGFCQIGFDGKEITRTRAYREDQLTKSIRLIPKVSDAGFVRSLGRWARLKEKYPDWHLKLGSRAEETAAPVYHSGGLLPCRISDAIVALQDHGEAVLPTYYVNRLLPRIASATVGQHDPLTGVYKIQVGALDRAKAASILRQLDTDLNAAGVSLTGRFVTGGINLQQMPKILLNPSV